MCTFDYQPLNPGSARHLNARLACCLIVLLAAVAGVAVYLFVFRSSSSSPPDSPQGPGGLLWHYPLLADYADTTGNTIASLANASWPVQFLPNGGGWFNPSRGGYQGVVVTGANFPPPNINFSVTVTLNPTPMNIPGTGLTVIGNPAASLASDSWISLGVNRLTGWTPSQVGAFSTPVNSVTPLIVTGLPQQLHLVLSSDGVNMTIYVNGTLYATTPFQAPFVPGTSGALVLGNVLVPSPAADKAFVGAMRHARGYDHALSAAEAATVAALDS